MIKRSKRYKKAIATIDRNKKYTIPEAIDLLWKTPKAKFDETVEISVRLGIDSRKSEQMIRGSISLPKGIGKSRKVVVFAEGEQAEEAKKAGADEVGSADLVKKIMDGWTEFDIAIATPAMMRHVGKLGKVLGPQGKMPSPKAGTVVESVTQAVREFKAGKIEFRADAAGNVHAPMGKRSFEPGAMAENVNAFLEQLKSMRPAAVKGAFLVKATLSASMSPGVPLEV